jgi:tetratricopeptide (TPR) repeat protein
MTDINDFAILFRKYRLRSEFESLSDFGHTLADKGYIYEDSLFSHWQKGKRIPKDRKLLLTILEIFAEKQGITNLKQANEFLESSGQGYLTEKEIGILPITFIQFVPFQAPAEVENFIGRQDYLDEVSNNLLNGKNILISGTPGSGKTALAIKVCHMLRDKFVDGILWYSLESSSVMNILASIAFTFGKDIGAIKDIESRASIVRSILFNKSILLVLDGALSSSRLDLLIPSSSKCSILVTSQLSLIRNFTSSSNFFLKMFNYNESFSLFEEILGKRFIEQNRESLINLFNLVDNLPIALIILAKQLKNGKKQLKTLLQEFKKVEFKLKDFSYGNKDLYSTIAISFNQLSQSAQGIFVTLGIFDGPDFSLEAIASINIIPKEKAKEALEELINFSLIEHSIGQRYRLHSFIKLFARKNLINNSIYKIAAKYYVHFLMNIKDKNKEYHELARKEADNIMFLIRRCYDLHFWDEVVSLWHNFGHFLWNVGYWGELLDINIKIKKALVLNKNYDSTVLGLLDYCATIHYWQGNMQKFRNIIDQALQVAYKTNNIKLINYSKLLKAKMECSLGNKYIKESVKTFIKLLPVLKKGNDYMSIMQCQRYLGETYLIKGNYKESEKYIMMALSYIEINSDKIFRTPYEIAANLNYLGGIYLKKGRYSKSKEFFLKSIQTEKENNRRNGAIIWSNICLGIIYEKQSHYFEAKECYKAAREEMELLGIKKNMERVSLLLMALKDELHKSKLYKQYIISN